MHKIKLSVDGVYIHDRAAWLEHKKLKRELIPSSRLVRGGNSEYRKHCAELNKLLAK